MHPRRSTAGSGGAAVPCRGREVQDEEEEGQAAADADALGDPHERPGRGRRAPAGRALDRVPADGGRSRYEPVSARRADGGAAAPGLAAALARRAESGLHLPRAAGEPPAELGSRHDLHAAVELLVAARVHARHHEAAADRRAEPSQRPALVGRSDGRRCTAGGRRRCAVLPRQRAGHLLPAQLPLPCQDPARGRSESGGALPAGGELPAPGARLAAPSSARNWPTPRTGATRCRA